MHGGEKAWKLGSADGGDGNLSVYLSPNKSRLKTAPTTYIIFFDIATDSEIRRHYP